MMTPSQEATALLKDLEQEGRRIELGSGRCLRLIGPWHDHQRELLRPHAACVAEIVLARLILERLRGALPRAVTRAELLREAADPNAVLSVLAWLQSEDLATRPSTPDAHYRITTNGRCWLSEFPCATIRSVASLQEPARAGTSPSR